MPIRRCIPVVTRPVTLALPYPTRPGLEPLEPRTLLTGTTPLVLPPNLIPHAALTQPKSLLTRARPALTAPVAVASNLATTALTAPTGKLTVSLTWTNNEPAATAYYVFRTDPKGTFAPYAKVPGPKATTFTDTAVTPNTRYGYKVITYTATGFSDLSDPVYITVPPAGPNNLAAQMSADTINGGSFTQLFWFATGSNIASYNIFRATGTGDFAKLASTTDRGYSDKSTTPDTLYRYQVQTVFTGGATSALSAPVSLITAPPAPANIAATLTPAAPTLSWTVDDPKATGFAVYRSIDGISYTQLAKLTGTATKTYTDKSLTTAAVASYKIATLGPGGQSILSDPLEVRLPLPASTAPILTTRFTNELVLYDTPANDSISISQTGTLLTIRANGTTLTKPATPGGLFVYLRSGQDTLTIDASVTTRTTVQAIDASDDSLTVNQPTANVWIDAADTFTGSALPHRVDTFVADVPKTPGASLPNPTDRTATVKLNLSLLGAAPAPADANQGCLGDCYLIGGLAALANTSPAVLQNAIVDMGDGTFTVQFYRSGQPEYYRISNAFATGGPGLTSPLFAHPRSTGKLWVPAIEKAFAYYRTGANTYASVNGGAFSDVWDALAAPSETFNPANYTDAALKTYLTGKLASAKAVAFATTLEPPVLVRAHAYSLLGVVTVKGINYYSVRNPWGGRGSALENQSGIATLTYAQLLANFAGGTALT